MFAAPMWCLCCLSCKVCCVVFAAPVWCLWCLSCNVCRVMFAAPMWCLCRLSCDVCRVMLAAPMCCLSCNVCHVMFAAPMWCLCRLSCDVCRVMLAAPMCCLSCDVCHVLAAPMWWWTTRRWRRRFGRRPTMTRGALTAHSCRRWHATPSPMNTFPRWWACYGNACYMRGSLGATSTRWATRIDELRMELIWNFTQIKYPRK